MRYQIVRMLLLCVVQGSLAVQANAGKANRVMSNLADVCPVESGLLPTQRWAKDMRDKNLQDVRKLLAPEIVFVDPDGTTYRRRTQVYNLYRQVFASFDSSLTLLPASHFWSPSQHLCTQRGTYSEDLRNLATDTVSHISGEYFFIFKARADGGWTITRQEWTITKAAGT